MFSPALQLLQSTYQEALATRGNERLRLFQRFGDQADWVARQYVYQEMARYDARATAYAHLMHNFWGSLSNLRMMAQHREYLASISEFGATKLVTAETWNDRVLVENGVSAIDLLRQAVEGNAPSEVRNAPADCAA